MTFRQPKVQHVKASMLQRVKMYRPHIMTSGAPGLVPFVVLMSSDKAHLRHWLHTSVGQSAGKNLEAGFTRKFCSQSVMYCNDLAHINTDMR